MGNQHSVNQWVEKLTVLLRDTENVEVIFQKVLSRLAVKRYDRENLEKMFDGQIQTWRDRGCPEEIVEILNKQKDAVLSVADKMTFGRCNIPILSVVPGTCLDIRLLMPMIKNGDKSGSTDLEQTDITDIIDVPTKPYWIYDVENGKSVLGKSPEKAERMFKKDGRSCLTVAEIIAIGIHYLPYHYMDATGSRYRNSKRVLFLRLRIDCSSLVFKKVYHPHDPPDVSCSNLAHDNVDSAGFLCGSPSCRSRQDFS